MSKRIYVIEWYECYQDERYFPELNDYFLTWIDNLSSRQYECFDDEAKFISRLRKLQNMSETKEEFCIRHVAVGTVNSWSGEIYEERY